MIRVFSIKLFYFIFLSITEVEQNLSKTKYFLLFSEEKKTLIKMTNFSRNVLQNKPLPIYLFGCNFPPHIPQKVCQRLYFPRN